MPRTGLEPRPTRPSTRSSASWAPLTPISSTFARTVWPQSKGHSLILNNSVTARKVLNKTKQLKGRLQDPTPSSSTVVSALDGFDDDMDSSLYLILDTPLPMVKHMNTVPLNLDSSVSDSSPPGVSLSVASPSGVPLSGAGSHPHDPASGGVTPGLLSGSPTSHTNS